MSQLWSPASASGGTSGGTSGGQADREHLHHNHPADDEPSSAGARKRHRGRRFAQIVRLKPESAAKYKEVHAFVWPEVLKQMTDCNIRDYSIFHDPGTGLLFGTFLYVGYDYAGDMERMCENAKVREWWRMTDGLQESLVEGATGSASEQGEPSWWKPVEEVFYHA